VASAAWLKLPRASAARQAQRQVLVAEGLLKLFAAELVQGRLAGLAGRGSGAAVEPQPHGCAAAGAASISRIAMGMAAGSGPLGCLNLASSAGRGALRDPISEAPASLRRERQRFDRGQGLTAAPLERLQGSPLGAAVAPEIGDPRHAAIGWATARVDVLAGHHQATSRTANSWSTHQTAFFELPGPASLPPVRRNSVPAAITWT